MSSSSSDPNPQGGSLSDMAVSGTTVPSTSATPNTIPSVPRPDQATDSSSDPNDLGTTDLAGQADNASDMPKSTRDAAPSSEIISGTGDSIPTETASKRMHELGNPDLSKGHARYDKHVRQKGSDFEKGAAGGEDAEGEEVRDGVVGGR
ncbi:MAG: hypothetical protein L6R41_008266 [Letrouitia leprolyta]|nr:MAG: hypothetical protein L6R41_008266 [Letrouitia leprolyta]